MPTNLITKQRLWLIAIAAGATVANNYYAQPLLNAISNDLHIPLTMAGNIPLCSQLGYGCGLFLIVPLGDRVKPRKLVNMLMLALSLVLIGMFLINNIAILYILSFLIGCCSVSAQVIIPLVSRIDPDNHGRNISVIFLGMLIAILTSRLLSGYMTQWYNWHAVYLFSAALVFTLNILLQRTIPDVPQTFTGNYGRLLLSTLDQFRKFSLLRTTAALGAIIFALFSILWTTLTLKLTGEPFHFSTGNVGLCGIIAIFGGIQAGTFCRFIERKSNKVMVLFTSLGILLVAALFLRIFENYLFAYVLAVVLISLGVQAMHVTNMARIGQLDITSIGRINTVYLVGYFFGGAAGTSIGVRAWAYGGWPVVTGVMIALTLLGAAILLIRGVRMKMSLSSSIK